ncbi:acyl-CoA dehydrogenase [Ectothiorhodospiraceae bacterium WFHF3C12]|nr:acyl-CoA dehydrogenase [Ectothiorhodospiraceae bacterium WFHF3C12]
MTDYHAPTRDMRFVLEELLDLETIAALPGFEETDVDVVNAILEEAAKLSGEVLAPLNRSGDEQGAQWTPDGVRAPEGFGAAYQQFVEGGWNGVAADTEFGGMGLPECVATATQEMWQSANMSFALCPMLTAGAIEALSQHGSAEQKGTYLEKMVTGEWPGTMDLTEPQAGSDLAAVRTRAVPDGDHYRLYGQKIYITWGEHDMAENIVHLVLARTPEAPEGVKGISLFLVPRYLVNDDGSVGEHNDMHCGSIEHKLGIHGSPTCTMLYGEKDGAIGYMVGNEGQGLALMFTMMNEARHKVGVQGLSIAERAYQQARWYANDRVQGKPLGYAGTDRPPIIHHPDVRRMLMTMRAQIEAMRALCYSTAASMDLARHHADEGERQASQARVDLLIPIVKGWCTELGVELASTGIQVHGGMGFVEETGAAQHLRDARIAPIYEGTNGIQANDLVGRKLLRDQGRAMSALIEEMREVVQTVGDSDSEAVQSMHGQLVESVEALREATEWILSNGAEDPVQGFANAHAYMMLAGYTCGGWLMARAAMKARAALDAGAPDAGFYEAKLVTARYYVEQILPRALGYARAVTAGGDAVMALSAEQF